MTIDEDKIFELALKAVMQTRIDTLKEENQKIKEEIKEIDQIEREANGGR